MKIIILASSIFYLLGLKVSNNLDIVKKTKIAPVIENKLELKNDINGKSPEKQATDFNSKPDSLDISGLISNKNTVQEEV
jgi:hypothetical protein